MQMLANASYRDGLMVPSTTSQKGLGVVTLLVTTERERDSFLCRDGTFSLCIHRFSFCQGLQGVSGYFHLRGSLNKFADFFVWALLLIVHT